jgi:hypothetical protein
LLILSTTVDGNALTSSELRRFEREHEGELKEARRNQARKVKREWARADQGVLGL